MGSAGIKSLVVAELYPWPAVDGYRQRLHHVVGGLCQVGTVDVVAPGRPGTGPPSGPPWEGVRRSLVVPVDAPPGPRGWVGGWVRGDLPRRLLSVDWSPLLDALASWRDRYDLVWYSHVDAWEPAHSMFGSVASIVDLDNLENHTMRLRRRVPPRFDAAGGVKGLLHETARWTTSRGFDLVDERRWDDIQRRCASSVEHVVVCSDVDVGRSGCPNAVVVPNGSEPSPHARTDRTRLVDAHPSLLFVGALDYEPNTEAMSWFLGDVWPKVRSARPEVRLRVVGRGPEALGSSARAAGVEVVGPVQDIAVELARADVVVVPIRVGGGTRLKVIEALANNIPLVTTTVGCEGIDVRNGRSALVSDDATAFAGAVLRLVADGRLRQRLADAGRALFERSHRWSDIRDVVAGLAESTVALHPGGR